MGNVLNMVYFGGGLFPTLEVTITNGTATSVTATLGSKVVNLTYDSAAGAWRGTLKAFGTWTVEATDGEKTVSDTVEVTSVAVYTATLAFPNVPSGYTEVEYLSNNGTAYLSLPLHDVETHRMTGTMSISSFNDGRYGMVFGVQVTAGSGSSGTGRGEWTVFSTFSIAVGTTPKPGLSENASFKASANTKYLFDISFIPQGTNPPRAAIINGASYPLSFSWTGTATLEDTTNLDKLLFAQKTGDAILLCSCIFYGNVKFYSADSDDAPLSMDLYPARRNSDSALGMWDKVTKTFYTNVGSGTFTAGPEV